ncbi:Non-specific protein-tyrosine kinase protein, partial [Dioscorea alata]
MAPRMSGCCLADKRAVVAQKTVKELDSSWETYSLKELLHATNHFSEKNKLGEGGFGTVYLGHTNKGKQIAVKRLKGTTAKAEMDFAVEVEILGRVRHKNLLGLRGFYAGGDERLIVYDYMPNHSIESHLHGNLATYALLDWPRRMTIAIGAAEGLVYLHHEAKPHIIHRDIKASNVLLDSKFNPRVADFGFAKLISEDVSHMTTKVKGTLGYLAPEYAMWGKVSKSCDVYSYGILVLELITGKKPVEKLEDGKKRDIVQWVTPFLEQGNIEDLVDHNIASKFEFAQLKVVLNVAMECINNNREKRPTMKQVIKVLKFGWEEKRLKEILWNNDSDGEEDQENNVGEKKKVR